MAEARARTAVCSEAWVWGWRVAGWWSGCLPVEALAEFTQAG